jgi:hypothetical protein
MAFEVNNGSGVVDDGGGPALVNKVWLFGKMGEARVFGLTFFLGTKTVGTSHSVLQWLFIVVFVYLYSLLN